MAKGNVEESAASHAPPATGGATSADSGSRPAEEEYLPDFVTIYFPTETWRKAAGKWSFWGILLLVVIALIGLTDLLGFVIAATAGDPKAIESLGLSRPTASDAVRVLLEVVVIALAAWIIIKQRGRIVAYRLAQGIELGPNGLYWKFRPGFFSLPLGARAVARANPIARWSMYSGFETVDHPWAEGVKAFALRKTPDGIAIAETDIELMYDRLGKKEKPRRLLIPYDPVATDTDLIQEYLLDVFEPLDETQIETQEEEPTPAAGT